ncbi:glycosyltransferase family 2 protein [Psychroserpens mesophilus]|uniref:glycosyltransferase family 2 protein n=1 Tax=Psychroserpens mesophilus TaxID=325473 RepID=UPI003D64663F
MSKPLVSVVVITYNHENYIKQTLDSILSQNTDFDFEVVVGEDKSPDNTLEVCKRYGDRITLIHSDENVGMIPNFIRTLEAAKGKYIAVCEGDDYWTDPLKLQKQVDFLESHPDYVICWTDYSILKDNGELTSTDFNFNEDVVEINYNNLFRPYCTYTLTSMFKQEAFDFELYKSLKYYKDNSLYVLLLREGKGAFLNFVSSVYRIHEGGVFSLTSNYHKNYTSYLNIKEIMDAVPESQTKNMKRVLHSLGNATAFGLLKLKQKGEILTDDQLKFMTDYFKNGNFKTKFKYFKRRFLK